MLSSEDRTLPSGLCLSLMENQQEDYHIFREFRITLCLSHKQPNCSSSLSYSLHPFLNVVRIINIEKPLRVPLHHLAACYLACLPPLQLNVQFGHGAREGRDRWTGTGRAAGGCRCRRVSSSSLTRAVHRCRGPGVPGRGDRTARRAEASEFRSHRRPRAHAHAQAEGRAGQAPWLEPSRGGLAMDATRDVETDLQQPMEIGEARAGASSWLLHSSPRSSALHHTHGEPRREAML